MFSSGTPEAHCDPKPMSRQRAVAVTPLKRGSAVPELSTSALSRHSEPIPTTCSISCSTIDSNRSDVMSACASASSKVI